MVERVTHSQDQTPGNIAIAWIVIYWQSLYAAAAPGPGCGSSSTRSPPSLTEATSTALTPRRRPGWGRGPGAASERTEPSGSQRCPPGDDSDDDDDDSDDVDDGDVDDGDDDDADDNDDNDGKRLYKKLIRK